MRFIAGAKDGQGSPYHPFPCGERDPKLWALRGHQRCLAQSAPLGENNGGFRPSPSPLWGEGRGEGLTTQWARKMRKVPTDTKRRRGPCCATSGQGGTNFVVNLPSAAIAWTLSVSEITWLGNPTAVNILK